MSFNRPILLTRTQSSVPSSSLACGAMRNPPPKDVVLAKLKRHESCAISRLSTQIRSRNDGACSSAPAIPSRYPPFPRSQRGMRLANSAALASSPTPPTQQKGVSCPYLLTMIPTSISRTIASPATKFRARSTAFCAAEMFKACAKSFPLPHGTTNTGNFARRSCGRKRWIVPSPPNTTARSAADRESVMSQCSTCIPALFSTSKSLSCAPGPRIARARMRRRTISRSVS